MIYDNIVKEAEKYYTEKFKENGETGPQAADWNSVEAQHIRFKQLTRLLPEDREKRFSLCDFGCGLGDYQDYLASVYSQVEYTGIDASSDIIQKTHSLHKGGTYICAGEIKTSHDYIVASGIFNVCQKTPKEQWKEYILSTVSMFAKYARKGFAFNCLTQYSDADRMQDYLYYADPLFLFDYCKTHFSRNVALLHDYDIYDFTILVRRDNTWHGKN